MDHPHFELVSSRLKVCHESTNTPSNYNSLDYELHVEHDPSSKILMAL